MNKMNPNKNQLSKTHVKDRKYETTSQTTQQNKNACGKCHKGLAFSLYFPVKLQHVSPFVKSTRPPRIVQLACNLIEISIYMCRIYIVIYH